MTPDKTLTSKDNHIEWIDTLRVVTMFLVIIGHSTYTTLMSEYGGLNFEMPEKPSLMHYSLDYIVKFIYSFHMPLFMAISGACFSFGKHKFKSLKHLALNKSKRLLVPFIFVTLLFSVPLKWLAGYYDASSFILKDIIFGQVFLMGNSHLWFLVSLFLCFIFFYITYPLQKRVPVLFWAVCLFMSWGHLYFKWHFFSGFGVVPFMKNFLFFSLGFYSYHWAENLKPTLQKLMLSFTSLALLFGIQIVTRPSWGGVELLVTMPLATLVALNGCVTMVILCKLLSNSSFKNTSFYSLLKKHNFQLYLFSDPINYPIITLIFSISAIDIFCNPYHSFFAFVIRILCNIGFALAIVWILTLIKGCFRKKNKKELKNV